MAVTTHARSLGTKPSCGPASANSDLAQLDHKPQGVINGFLIAEGLANLGFQQNEIRARLISLGVLTTNSPLEQAAQIVFRAQFVTLLMPGFLHELFSHLPLAFEH